jgi:hypothetical protein
MMNHTRAPASTILVAGVCLMLAVAGPVRLRAEEPPRTVAGDLIKRVVFDPTTYSPALITYYSMLRDWQTSQPFFAHGANEMNPRYTISGRPDDLPLTYADGRRQIVREALLNLEVSAVSNMAGQVVERMLIEHYPTHRKLLRGLGWAERLALSSFLTYQLSIEHFRQVQLNEQMARQYGF